MWMDIQRSMLWWALSQRSAPRERHGPKLYSRDNAMDVPRDRPPSRRPLLLVCAGAAVLALVTLALTRLAQAPPVVDRSAVWIDSVRRGGFVRQVGGPGTLVPEQIAWVTARTAGRVERVHLLAGSPVQPDTVLLELSNAELELEALKAERQYRTAEANLVDLRATLEGERLRQMSERASVRADSQNARRRAEANERLMELEMLGTLEYQRTKDEAEELAERLRIEEQRSQFLKRSSEARLTAQQGEIERLRALAEHQRERVASLRVRAATAGVLQELPLEVGQRVTAGDLLAKVVEPTRLKAELRIPEKQAREVELGQSVEIDTRNSVIRGRVTRIDPAVQRGTVTVDVALEGELPRGARPDLSVDGRIELERLEDVLYTGRPAFGHPGGKVTLFRLTPDGDTAERVTVRMGGSSVSEIEVVEGLQEGDRVILSDMSEWDAVDRIQLD